jgi:cytochrome c556
MEGNLHFKPCVATLLVAMTGAVVMAQKVATPEELDKAMKKTQPALQAANKAVNSTQYGEASKQLAVIKQVMVDTQPFWIQHKKDDAVKANKDTIAKIEEAEALLNGAAPEQAKAAAAIKQIGAACRTCHENYRVRDADNNWVLKPGSIGN